ncbi:MAG TPA: glycine zipper 2TM domain-containing protein [Croceibacterium sp.]
MKNFTTNLSLALAASGLALSAVPAAAADLGIPGERTTAAQSDTWERHRSKRSHRGRDYDRRYVNQYAYGEPVYRDTRVWRGNNGQYHCQKKDGTTGLIIGGAVGALLGREVDGGHDRTLGTILGGAAGALLGKEVAQGGSSCR